MVAAIEPDGEDDGGSPRASCRTHHVRSYGAACCASLAGCLLACATSATASAQGRRGPTPFARVAWSAPAPGVRLDRVYPTHDGDLVWVGERGLLERRRSADGVVVARHQEPDCHLQEVLESAASLFVACLGGTGGASRHELLAFDLRSLRVVWRLRLGDAIVWPRHVDGPTLFGIVRSRRGGGRLRVAAIDVASGALRFDADDAPLPETPCAMREDFQTTAELVVVSACRSGTAAFSRRDGSLRWSASEPGLRTVLRARDVLVAWTDAGRVEAFDLQTGARRFRVEEPGSQVQPLVVGPSGDAVIVQRWGRTLVSIDVRTGATRWSASVAYGGEAWVRGGALVVRANDGVVVLDVATGAERARSRGDAPTSVWVTDDRVLVTEADARESSVAPGAVLRAMGLDGGERWTSREPVAPSSPLTVGARAFVCSEAGDVYAIDRATGAAEWRIDVGRDPGTYAACAILATEHGVVARRGEELVFVANEPETFVPPSVRVTGRVVGDVPVRGVRVWVGHRSARADARGRFDARVVAATSVVVRVEPRDAGARCAS
ncbi:MAG: PQQ-binding-like beta-propeller repeat protein, partial [Deltaproteobacteria bacterium]|nr:PQQ-binding-like beta-propeller repeat protein [Deltaproteobacteria bacterium]